MAYRSLRDYLDALSERGLLHIIDETVCKDTELVPLVRLQFRGLAEEHRKAFWFRSVTDSRGRNYDGSVVLGALGSSRAVYGAALGVAPDGIAAAWARAHGHHLPPRVVARDNAPVKEMIHRAPDSGGGVDRFPHLISTPGFDPAPFITAGVWVTRDPENGAYNLGIYRGMIKAPRPHRLRHRRADAASRDPMGEGAAAGAPAGSRNFHRRAAGAASRCGEQGALWRRRIWAGRCAQWRAHRRGAGARRSMRWCRRAPKSSSRENPHRHSGARSALRRGERLSRPAQDGEDFRSHRHHPPRAPGLSGHHQRIPAERKHGHPQGRVRRDLSQPSEERLQHSLGDESRLPRDGELQHDVRDPARPPRFGPALAGAARGGRVRFLAGENLHRGGFRHRAQFHGCGAVGALLFHAAPSRCRDHPRQGAAARSLPSRLGPTKTIPTGGAPRPC